MAPILPSGVRFLFAGSVAAVVLLLLASQAPSAAAAPTHDTSTALERITDRNIASRLAVDIVREQPFPMKPDAVVAWFQAAGYGIVPAPDPTLDHPALFHVRARFRVLGAGALVHPTLTIIVSAEGVSLNYRDVSVSKVSRATKVDFCNEWNYKKRLSTCHVDVEGFLNLHNDVLFFNTHIEKQTSTARDATNAALLEHGEHFFKASVEQFAAAVVNTLLGGGHADL